MITIPLTSLPDQTGAGRLNDGYQLSPSLSAYLGCDAETIPCFLDGSGAIIDLSRARRLFTSPARTALKSGTAAAPGPAATGRSPGAKWTCPGSADSLLDDSGELAGCEVVQGGVQALGVVQLDVAQQQNSGGGEGL